MSNDDWAELGDTVCEILWVIYVDKRAAFEGHAKAEGCAVEQLAAAAITEAVRRKVERTTPGPSTN